MSGVNEITTLRQVVYDTGIALAETNDIAASQDFDDVTGYAGATETDNTLTLTAIAARIEHPRNVVLTVVAGGGLTGGKAAVYGMGMNGQGAREEFTITGTGTFTGNVPFCTVDRISIWGCTGTLTTDDVISAGIGAKIGLPMPSDEKLLDVIKERFDLVEIAVTGTVNRTYGTYIPASTLDASKALELWYTTKRIKTF